MSELSACSNCWGTGFDVAGRPCTHPPLQWRNPAPHAAPPAVPSSPTVRLNVGVTDVRQTAEYSFGYQQALEDMKNTRAPSATLAGVDEVARDDMVLVPRIATDAMLKSAYPLHWFCEPGNRLKENYQKMLSSFASLPEPWISIDTSPRDGTSIILWNEGDSLAQIGMWIPAMHAWLVDSEYVDEGEISHWLPLPCDPRVTTEQTTQAAIQSAARGEG